ncbi:glycosyltransferase family 4 protein [Thioclava nitratireducens]|uniref:glycosyltransferase family 4 protein n=1 Tax=Thioclava nitratireducens TaxID=1915078 RepID=UPI0024818768|nr:glycosyltransferase family 4 protein [Thioclava nitratireducens]WGT51480.1 glycosyltransferase family 4 protein [Thioclava nitratireducens]
MDLFPERELETIRVVALSRYGRLGASSRLRMMQFAPALKAAGVELAVLPFFDDLYLQKTYAGESKRAQSVLAFLRRFRTSKALRDSDLIWVEKEALPWLPWIIENAVLPSHVPIVSDYDDAIFHNYDIHPSSVVRRLMGAKIDRVMARSSLVAAGNRYLADRAEKAGASTVEIVPTVVDTTVYSTRTENSEAKMSVSVGWIGTPSTWAAYMEPMMPMLQESIARVSSRLRVVGAGEAASRHPNVDNLAWSEEEEVSEIQKMAIGIMPLTDTPWARGKCGYKLIQYMACGLPVIASPVGVNSEIVEHGVNGFLASNEVEWRQALDVLLTDPGLRARMGAAGRKKVEDQYSLQVWGPRVAQMLRDVAVTHSKKRRGD